MLKRGSEGQWSIAVRSTRKSKPIDGSSRSQVRSAATAGGSAFAVSALTFRSALRARADEARRRGAAERTVLADPLLQFHERVQQHLGPRRAAGDVVVHRHD